MICSIFIKATSLDAYFFISLFSSDIALLKLPSPVRFSEYIKPIVLPTLSIASGMEVIAMGYGMANLASKVFPKNLQYTTLRTVGLQECAPVKPNLVPKDTLICAKDAKATICLGDGGGPLVSPKTNKLVGIAVSSWDNCEFGPQGFTSTTAYLGWINGIMGTIKFLDSRPGVIV